MTRIAYLDCFSGASGDMLLGALLDTGLSLRKLREALAGLPLDGYSLDVRRVQMAGLAATQALVEVRDEQPPRTLSDILDLIQRSSLPAADKEKGAAVFQRLAEAEATVHGETMETVHLHDVGAVDAVVDVMGTIAGLRLLKVERICASALPLGEGEIIGRHGRLPVPAPATLELLSGARAPLRGASSESPPRGELVTPTGAAILATLARFQLAEMTLERVGYGAGSRNPAGHPNVLRLWLGEEVPSPTRSMLLIETNVDDMTAEMLAYALERLLAVGAMDAWFTPIQMKKGRPGVMLSVICTEAQEETMARLLLRETSTLGVRVRPLRRWEAQREELQFESSLGPAAAKVKRLPDEPARVAPEYEDCRRLAERSGLPLAEVYRIIQAEGEAELGKRSS